MKNVAKIEIVLHDLYSNALCAPRILLPALPRPTPKFFPLPRPEAKKGCPVHP